MSPDAQITGLAAHFSAGRYDLITDRYEFPVPVYLNGNAAILADRSQMWTFFQSLHSRFSAAGMPRLEGKVVSVELPRSGRFRLWSDWQAVGGSKCQHVMRTVCYNRGTHACHRTVMIQIAMPEEIAAAAPLTAA